MALPLRAMAGSQSLRRHSLGSACASLLALALTPAGAQTRADHVLWRNARGQVNTLAGQVIENSLTQVVVQTGSSQRKISAADVERVEFGEVPAAYQDAQAYLGRSDFENAAAKFSLAAGDPSARMVVRAASRLAAAQAWLRRGAAEPAAFQSARKECEQFLSEHRDNRDMPQARLLLGRAQRLSGETATAAETYAAFYREASGQAAAGQAPTMAFQAGLGAAEAYLAAGATPKAREIYLGLDGAIAGTLSTLGAGDARRAALLAIQGEARLGEGFCLLAAGSVSQAKTFFQSQIGAVDAKDPRRFAARLGLAEALLAEGNARAAQLEFAQVSALDTDEDRVARALVGLAQCALKLTHASARKDAKGWLETVRSQYGDTPAVLKAQELLATL